MAVVSWKKVVETAKALYGQRDNFAYFYGAKGQVLTDPVMDALVQAEPQHFAKYSPEQMVNIRNYSRGKVGLDCSGFVCYVLQTAGVITKEQWTYSTALIGKCDPKMDPLYVPAAGILYRCPPGTGRHVGIDIDKGKFLHMGREGSSIEIGDNHSHFWEIGGCYPDIDYSGWSQDGSAGYEAEALETMYVRSGPSIQCDIVGDVLIGEIVTVLEALPSGWLRIRWGDREAYTSNVGGKYYRKV